MIYIRRTVKITAFILGLIALLLALSIMFIPKNNMKEFGMEEVVANGVLGEKENTIDVIILGDSEAYSSFSPMQIWRDTGYSVYVCGTSAQTLNYSLKLLQRATEKQNPKIVILETNAIYREITGLEAIGAKLGNIFSIFDYHDRWKSMKLKDILTSPDYTWTDDKKGYYFNKGINAANSSNHMSFTEEIENIPGINVSLVKNIRDVCERKGAELVLISTPSTVNWNYKKHNGISQLAKEIECEYIDLNLENDIIGIDWLHDTRDKGDHLNHFGAVKVTNYLSDYLQKTNLLSDHREDEAFQNWNEALEKYLKLTE